MSSDVRRGASWPTDNGGHEGTDFLAPVSRSPGAMTRWRLLHPTPPAPASIFGPRPRAPGRPMATRLVDDSLTVAARSQVAGSLGLATAFLVWGFEPILS